MQHLKIGGDWAVACVLDYKKLRQLVRYSIFMQEHFCKMSLKLTNIRGWMGPDLQIVVLDMKLEDQMDRMRKRHGGHESAVDFAKVKCFDGRRYGDCDIDGNLGR